MHIDRIDMPSSVKEDTSNGLPHISNTSSRVEKIVAEILKVAADGGSTFTAAQKLCGRMQFAEAPLYGRT